MESGVTFIYPIINADLCMHLWRCVCRLILYFRLIHVCLICLIYLCLREHREIEGLRGEINSSTKTVWMHGKQFLIIVLLHISVTQIFHILIDLTLRKIGFSFVRMFRITCFFYFFFQSYLVSHLGIKGILCDRSRKMQCE